MEGAFWKLSAVRPALRVCIVCMLCTGRGLKREERMRVEGTDEGGMFVFSLCKRHA